MSLLTIVQNACSDLGLNTPSSVIGNTDQQVEQLLQLANREGVDLARRFNWQRLVRENTFTMVSGQDQGLINGTVVTDSDYEYMIPETTWNRTTDLPITGPVNSADWQVLQSFTVTGPYEKFRISEGKFYINPAPSGGDTLAFEYKSTHWCESSGGDGQDKWTADSDVGRLDERLMELGLIWRWRKRKGLEYSEDMRDYERQVTDAMARDKSARTLSYNDSGGNRLPGIVVPWGNYNQ